MIDRETLKLFYLGWPAYYEQDAGSSSIQQARKYTSIQLNMVECVNPKISSEFHYKILVEIFRYSGLSCYQLRLGYRQCHTAVRGRGDSSGKLNCSFRGSALCHRPGASYGRKIKRGKVKCFPKSRNRKTLIQ